MASFEFMLHIGETALEGFPESSDLEHFITFSGIVVPETNLEHGSCLPDHFKFVSVIQKVYKTVESSDNMSFFFI